MTLTSNSTSSKEYYALFSELDLSGYSINDSLRLAYYKNDNNLDKLVLRFYSSDVDFYYYEITPPSGTGYKTTDDILIGSLSTSGAPDKTVINKISIVVYPKIDVSTSVGMDGLRINDEDTFDPIFGIISRSVLSVPLVKINGRQVDIEYRLDLGF